MRESLHGHRVQRTAYSVQRTAYSIQRSSTAYRVQRTAQSTGAADVSFIFVAIRVVSGEMAEGGSYPDAGTRDAWGVAACRMVMAAAANHPSRPRLDLTGRNDESKSNRDARPKEVCTSLVAAENQTTPAKFRKRHISHGEKQVSMRTPILGFSCSGGSTSPVPS